MFWFLSVAHTSLGQATALFQSSAIFVTVLSPLILREKVGIYRGSAVMIGLLGIVMITNPFGDALNIGSLYGLGSALAGAFRRDFENAGAHRRTCHRCPMAQYRRCNHLSAWRGYPFEGDVLLSMLTDFFPISSFAWLCSNLCSNWFHFSLQAWRSSRISTYPVSICPHGGDTRISNLVRRFSTVEIAGMAIVVASWFTDFLP